MIFIISNFKASFSGDVEFPLKEREIEKTKRNKREIEREKRNERER